jgi:hypothetical protein
MVFGLKAKPQGYNDSFQSVESSGSEFEMDDRRLVANRGRQLESEEKPRSRSRSAARKIAATVAKLAAKLKSDTVTGLGDEDEGEGKSPRRRWSIKTADKNNGTSIESAEEPKELSKLEAKISSERPSRLPAPSRDGLEDDILASDTIFNNPKYDSDEESSQGNDSSSDKKTVTKTPSRKMSARPEKVGASFKSPIRSRHRSKSRVRASSEKANTESASNIPTDLRAICSVPSNSNADTASVATLEARVSVELQSHRSPTKTPRRRFRSKTPETRSVGRQYCKEENSELSCQDTESDSSEIGSCTSPTDGRGLLSMSTHSTTRLGVSLFTPITRRESFRIQNTPQALPSPSPQKDLSKSGSLHSISSILKSSSCHSRNSTTSSRWGSSNLKHSDHDRQSPSTHTVSVGVNETIEIDEELETCLIATMSTTNHGSTDAATLAKDVQEWRNNRLQACKTGNLRRDHGKHDRVSKSRSATNGKDKRSISNDEDHPNESTTKADSQQHEPVYPIKSEGEQSVGEHLSGKSERSRGRSRGTKLRSSSSSKTPELVVDRQKAATGNQSSHPTASQEHPPGDCSLRRRGSSHPSKGSMSSRRPRSKSKHRSEEDDDTAAEKHNSTEAAHRNSDHAVPERTMPERSRGMSISDHVNGHRKDQQGWRGSASSKTRQSLNYAPTTPTRQKTLTKQSQSTRRLKPGDNQMTPSKSKSTVDTQCSRVEDLMPRMETNETDRYKFELLPVATPKPERKTLRQARTPTRMSRQRSVRMSAKSPRPLDIVEGLTPTRNESGESGSTLRSERKSSRQTSERTRTRSKDPKSSKGDDFISNDLSARGKEESKPDASKSRKSSGLRPVNALKSEHGQPGAQMLAIPAS